MVAMVTVEQHLGIVVMTTQPNFVPDLPSVNNKGKAVMPRASQQQSEPQNLSSSQTSEGQVNPLLSLHDKFQHKKLPSLAKVLVPAGQLAVVAHSFSEQPSQQQSVLFQALTAQSPIIALTVPSQDGERHEITVPGVQYIDEGGGSNVFSTPVSQMTTFSIYTPETASMYTPNSTSYYNSTSSSDNYSQMKATLTESENSPVQASCYPNSRLSADSINWLVENYEVANGMSVPRSIMYSHYLKHCNDQEMEPLNAASFGKLIRSVFPGLKTRRLGTRGNSKYHYYGIRLKPSSPINRTMEDIVNTTYRHNSYNHVHSRVKSEHGIKVENNVNCNGKRYLDSDDTDKKGSASSQPKSHSHFLGDASTAIPDVDIDLVGFPFPSGITVEKISLFRNAYRKHCENILEAVINFKFSEVESLWRSFWDTSTENMSNSDSDLVKPFLLDLVSYKPIQEFIKQTDFQFYQNLVDVLIPDVLRLVPATLNQAIRNFAKSLEGGLRAAITECSDDILKIKMSAIRAFAQTLRRYTSLNHLAQAAKTVLQCPRQTKQMTLDLNKVDFRNIQEQASYVCKCDESTVRGIWTSFRETLQRGMWLEGWATWLENIVHKNIGALYKQAYISQGCKKFPLEMVLLQVNYFCPN
ncbi:MHC class II regulatory factor RFX1 [Caerostris extrusa]|uniref:MHC class II regulatory factor RFX1 n=1 Tax=Caerostris extrusa TaxID=172846 RepID=A0AAV4QGH1_CAEEX|nr:MHC class II regulatory factor RFX1 [Caerostris extrusa]